MSLRGPRTAWVLLTRLPWPGEVAPLAAAAGWFPLVGAALGAVAGLACMAARRLGELPAAAVALAVQVLLTGGLHWDGFADCGDALLAGGGRQRRLEVMRDPRLGTGGVLALALGAIAAAGLLAELPARRTLPALAAAEALSRWVIVLAAAWLPPADPDRGIGRELARRVGWPAVAGATVTAVAAGALVGGPALVASALAGLGAAWWLSRPLGGATGDVYGAAAVIGWLAALGAAAWQ